MGAGLVHLFASTKEKCPAPGTGEIAKMRLKKMLKEENGDVDAGGEHDRRNRRNCKERLTQGKKHDKTIQIKRL